MGRSDQVDVTRRRTRVLAVTFVSVAAAGIALLFLISAWHGAVEARRRNARIHFFAVLSCRPVESPDKRPGESEEDHLIRISRRLTGSTTTMSPAMQECVAKTERAMQPR
jgi:hypothetical protein